MRKSDLYWINDPCPGMSSLWMMPPRTFGCAVHSGTTGSGFVFLPCAQCKKTAANYQFFNHSWICSHRFTKVTVFLPNAMYPQNFFSFNTEASCKFFIESFELQPLCWKLCSSNDYR
jgi:hypothetical protein